MPVNHNVEKIGAGMINKVAVMPGWFPGLTHVEMVEQVAAYGFSAFENLGAGKWEDKCEVRAKCEELGIEIGAISAGGATIVGDGPVNRDFHDQFVSNVAEAIEQAKALGTKILLGISGAERADIEKERQMENLVIAGKRIAPMVEDAGMTFVWELLNIKVNHAGYFLVTSPQGGELVRRTDRPGIKFLNDIYHQQISEGDVIRNIQEYINEIGHFHFADNPGRHEPGTGEMCYKNIFKAIHETGYRGIISAEFSKIGETEDVLRAIADCGTW